MAAKKKTSKKKTSSSRSLAVKRDSKAPAKLSNIEKTLAQYASKESAREKITGTNKLSIKGGKFSYQGASLGKETSVIVLAYAFENALYDVAYDPDNPSTPGCFALDEAEDNLSPHAEAPNKQFEGACEECPHNAWGSSETGSRGKACSNRRRLVVISADEKDYSDCELAVLNFGPTSLKNWKGYVKGLADKLKLPPFGVVTNLSFDEDEDNEVLIFNCESKLKDKKKLGALLNRLEEAEKMALQPYDKSGYHGGKGGKKKTGKKKASKKKAGKKKTGRSKYSRG